MTEQQEKQRYSALSEPKGLRDISTSLSKRSMPGNQERHYLDLYLLQMERERLVKEMTWIKKRGLRLGQKLDDIRKKTAEKQEKASQSAQALPGVPATSSPGFSEEHEGEKWTTMTLDY